MTKHALLFIALWLIIISCGKMDDAGRAIVDKIVFLQDLPSASALAVSGDSIFIAGDDSPVLFLLDTSYRKVDGFMLLPHFADQYRIPKPEKPDLESIAEGLYNGKPCLALFGSGSLSPQRDSMVLFFPGEPESPRVFGIDFLYKKIRDSAGIAADELNIEGAVIVGDDLHLFNRGRNFIATLSWSQLLVAINTTARPQLAVDIKWVQLPLHKGVLMGISGAASVHGENRVLFTATVEDTDNWYDDGEILGSYIGSLRSDTGDLLWLAPVTDTQGAMTGDKLESIACLTAGQPLRVLAVTDNDDGTSKLLELTIHR